MILTMKTFSTILVTIAFSIAMQAQVQPTEAYKAFYAKNTNAVKPFLTGASDEPSAMLLLNMLAEIDPEGVTVDALADHYMYARSFEPDVFNPIVCDEPLSQWRAYLESNIKAKTATEWKEWVKTHITINEQETYKAPAEVWDTRSANRKSYNIFIVAGARAIGIPARLNQQTGEPEIGNPAY